MRRSLIILALLGLTLAACNSADGGPGTSTTPTTDQPVTQPTEAVAEGVVAVHLEEVQGVFIEGFEVGIRFETIDGTPIATTLWSDFVQSQGEPTLEGYYTSVLEQTVPAGPIVVLAEANIGIGPGPVIPDVNGNLPCTLELDVPAGGRVDVEVSFSGDANCLRQG